MDARQIEAIFAEPRYDGTGWDAPWNHWDWARWHGSLVGRFGGELADQLWARAWVRGLSRFAGGEGAAPGAGIVFDAVPTASGRADEQWLEWVRESVVREAAVLRGLAGYLQTADELAKATNKLAGGVARTPGMLLLFFAGVVATIALRKK